jgi:peptidoglycan hydrolase FlgJ
MIRTSLPAPAAGGISTDTSRLKSSANLEKAGQQFEAIFTQTMLKTMHDAKLSDGLFDSSESDTWQGMQDQQYAQAMAQHTPLGIGKALTKFLAKSQPDLQAPPSPALPGDAS